MLRDLKEDSKQISENYLKNRNDFRCFQRYNVYQEIITIFFLIIIRKSKRILILNVCKYLVSVMLMIKNNYGNEINF